LRNCAPAWKPAARKLAERRTGWEQIAALFAPAAAPPGRRPEKRTAIERPIIEVFPGGIPDDFSPAEIAHAVRGAAGFKELPPMSDKTILRAAGRLK
jgi:hypothetical protein